MKNINVKHHPLPNFLIVHIFCLQYIIRRGIDIIMKFIIFPDIIKIKIVL